jgi:putative methionine-R-sulfoxide reductase with GAF domain
MWQAGQSAAASAVGATAASREITWVNHPATDADRHLAVLGAEGINTVVLVPVSQQGRPVAVLELCTQGSAQETEQANAALRSIEAEIAAASQRLLDAANANQWGRRRR